MLLIDLQVTSRGFLQLATKGPRELLQQQGPPLEPCQQVPLWRQHGPWRRPDGTGRHLDLNPLLGLTIGRRM